MSRNRLKILGIKIDNLIRREILDKIEFADGLQIATVNPEFILGAQKNEVFRNILNSEKTLCVADGIGLKFAAWRQGQNLKHHWAGIDLMWEILKIANKRNQRVFLIGNKNGLSSWQETTSVIRETYPSLKVSGVDVGVTSRVGEDLRFKIFYPAKLQRSGNDLRRDAAPPRQSESDIENLQAYIIKHESDIVFCSLGAPHQEILLHQLRGKTKLTIGVGGSFDFITRKVRRAPKFLRKIGLEWLWRLIVEPQYRFKKIWSAVVAFPLKIIFKI
jgi:N-acetylglucosaminyldiphosphoundecaprenol N-acetyl-beta-D-mannosaminyltransferase